MVTVASFGPSAMSGSDTGLATSAAFCAIASAIQQQVQRRQAREQAKAGQRQGGGKGAARDVHNGLPGTRNHDAFRVLEAKIVAMAGWRREQAEGLNFA